jgi:hypothetical protein
MTESTAESALVPLLLTNILQRKGPFIHTIILLLLVAFPEFRVYVFLIQFVFSTFQFKLQQVK